MAFDVRNGWRLYQYPAFQQPYDSLSDAVGRLAVADPHGYASHPKAKLLARVNQLILDEIPADPTAKVYRQGNTLGGQYKNWSRAKFLGRFRLFFRYDSKSKVIIYCWLNDEATLRKAGADSDPYTVFTRMLKSGRPPNDWNDLLKSVCDQTIMSA